VVKGIYDKKLNDVYPLSSVGSSADDGEIIKDPQQDTSDPFADYDGSTQRFFWIIEGIMPGQVNLPLLEAYQAYYLYGHDLMYINSVQYNRARITPRILNEWVGF